MLIFNLPNTHCSYLAPVKPCLCHFRSLVDLDFGTRTSSTKAAWPSDKISEAISWYESSCNSFMAWLRGRSVGIRSKQLLFPGPLFGRCCGRWPSLLQQKIPSFSLLLQFHILTSLYYMWAISIQKWGGFTVNCHFLRWLTPGDKVRLEVFKWLHWGLGMGAIFHAYVSNDQLWQCTGIWRQSLQIF